MPAGISLVLTYARVGATGGPLGFAALANPIAGPQDIEDVTGDGAVLSVRVAPGARARVADAVAGSSNARDRLRRGGHVTPEP